MSADMSPEVATAGPSEYKLTVEIKNEQPVLLEDFTTSFRAIADEYEAYVQDHASDSGAPSADARLYVREIRPGSIIADLVVLAPLALPFIENAQSVVNFAKFLGTAYAWLRGDSKDKPPLTSRDLENLRAIVEPVAKDAAAQVNITGNHNQTVVYNIHMDSRDANAVQNTARRELEAVKEPTKREHEKVLMYFFQARNDPKSDKGDRAKIESINPGPVKVVFADEHLKARALETPSGPFHCAFVVDVAVETIKGRPALYRVTAIHDVFDQSSDTPS